MRESGRVEVSERPGALSVVIRNAPSPAVSWFASAWLGLWFTAESKIVGVLVDGSAGLLAPFVRLFLVPWTIAGAVGALALAWNTRGRVELELDAERLSIRRAVGPLGLTRVHDVRRLGAFRLAGSSDARTATRWSALQFEEGGSPRTVGVRLQADDGALVLDALRRHLPARTRPPVRPGAVSQAR